MNRPFPRLVLKIERGEILQGTCIPSGRNRNITWVHPKSEHDAVELVKFLFNSRTSYDLVRVTTIAVYQNGEAWKLTTKSRGDKYTWHFDRRWMHGYPQRTAACAILPKEVLDEAAR